MYDSVPDIDALIAAPDAADIPDNPAVLYAVCAAISSRMNPKNAGNVIKYLDRLPQQEFAAFVIKDGVNRHKELKQSKDIRSWIMRQGKNLIL